MRIEFLGSGGAIPTPRPGCDCRVCAQARARGVPYSRMGPSIFVHGPDLLIDTPEDIVHALNRANIRQVKAATYSHWHPDHTAGIRVWESLNLRLWDWPPKNLVTTIYLPQKVKEDFDHWQGLAEKLDYLEKRLRVVKQVIVPEGESFVVGDTAVQPVLLPNALDASQAHVYAFILDDGAARVLIAPDELVGWTPPDLGPLDLAILPAGLFEFDPLTGERIIPVEHPVLKSEATFEQTLEIVRQLGAPRTILTHIEEADGASYDDLIKVQRKLMTERRELGNVSFAFDRLQVNV